MDSDFEKAFIKAEEDFIKSAKSLADQHGIDYQDFIELGIEPEVLKRAGFTKPE